MRSTRNTEQVGEAVVPYLRRLLAGEMKLNDYGFRQEVEFVLPRVLDAAEALATELAEVEASIANEFALPNDPSPALCNWRQLTWNAVPGDG